MDDRRLEEAWDVEEPTAGFAERVVQRALEKPVRRFPGSMLAVVALAAAAAVLVFGLSRTPSTGEVAADTRREVAIGERATAVLEAGSRLKWRGDRVVQERGDVFYRVERGGTFAVETPAGVVEVLGTCFRVRVRPSLETKGDENVNRKKEVALAAGSAAMAALAVVTVYEGKVRLSHAKGNVELAAGEAGALDADGARRADGEELSSAEQALGQGGSSLAKANDELAKDIAELNRKIKHTEKAKEKLEGDLLVAQTELAKRTDAGAPRGRHDFDLDAEDWKTLAAEGTIKFRVPCLRSTPWKPDGDVLDKLGLSPDDAATLSDAYKRSNDRVWGVIKPLCEKAIGNPAVVDSLGPDTCTHVVVDMARKKDGDAATEAMRRVAEIRAGLRPEPAPGAPQSPVFDTFWALTGEMSRFEADLGQSFGPEEAKRLAYADGMCVGHSTFGGPGPRK
jgi:ferric-dicitrate binding protein FerR (iron transport regulator)